MKRVLAFLFLLPAAASARTFDVGGGVVYSDTGGTTTPAAWGATGSLNLRSYTFVVEAAVLPQRRPRALGRPGRDACRPTGRRRGRIDVAARRRVVAVHVSTSDRGRPGLRGTAPRPRAGGRAPFRGLSLSSSRIAGTAPLRFAPCGRFPPCGPLRLAAAPPPAPRSPRRAPRPSTSPRLLPPRPARAPTGPPGPKPPPPRTRRTGPASAPAAAPPTTGLPIGASPPARCALTAGSAEDAPLPPHRRTRAPAPVAWRGSPTSPDPTRRPGRTPSSFPPPTPAASPPATTAASCARSSLAPPVRRIASLRGAARRNHCSVARATPSFTRSENTGCRCGLSRFALHLRQPRVDHERVRQLARRYVSREAPPAPADQQRRDRTVTRVWGFGVWTVVDSCGLESPRGPKRGIWLTAQP